MLVQSDPSLTKWTTPHPALRATFPASRRRGGRKRQLSVIETVSPHRTSLNSPPQPEARPALEVYSAGEMEALRAPRCEYAGYVGDKKTGDNGVAVGGRGGGERRREQPQRFCQDVGENDVEGRAFAQKLVLHPPRDARPAKLANPVQPRIGVGDLDRHWIDIAEPHLPFEDFTRRDRQHAGAAADVENLLRPAALEKPVEMEEAAAGRAVMAGAEGEAGLYLDGDVACADFRPVVAAMDEKASGPDRLKTGKRIRHPVALFRRPERRRLRGLLVGGDGDQRPDLVLVRREAEIGLDQPRPPAARPRVLGLEGGRGGLRRLETLDYEVRDRPRPPFVGDQCQAVGGVVGRQAFEHGNLSLLPFAGEGGARSATDEGNRARLKDPHPAGWRRPPSPASGRRNAAYHAA